MGNEKELKLNKREKAIAIDAFERTYFEAHATREACIYASVEAVLVHRNDNLTAAPAGYVRIEDVEKAIMEEMAGHSYAGPRYWTDRIRAPSDRAGAARARAGAGGDSRCRC